jgi:hypothetical protein
MSALGHVGLSKACPQPKRAKCSTDAAVIRPVTIGAVAYLTITSSPSARDALPGR